MYELFCSTTTLCDHVRAVTMPIDIPPQIRNSPTLQKWLNQAPDIRREIANDPSFRTRLQVGYSRFTQANTNAVTIGLEDLRLGPTPVTLSSHFSSGGTITSAGVDTQTYLLPLGGYINIAPVVGWRSLSNSNTQNQGLNLGAKLMLIPSRGGGADVAIQQTWINVGSDREVGIGKVSVGYAIAPQFRLATTIERWQGQAISETRCSLLLEWMP
ncbi:MAG: hypothetical protein LH631_05125 [Alkalinema sp. CAN_BIN05]|nr:hypothetical protein [Alkalinema sp. CAN_BIN05]